MKTLCKKAFAVLSSAILLLLSVLPFAASAATIDEISRSVGVSSGTTGECTWSMDDSMGTLTISGNGSMGDYNYDEAPWSGWQYQISSVVIENGVTNISDHAFDDYLWLDSITMADSVVRIGDDAFRSCRDLKSVTFSKNLISIGESAFDFCTSLIDVTIPGSVTSVGNYAFCECFSLLSLTIPDTVTSIGKGLLQNCSEVSVFGKKGSYAESYANDNHIPFIEDAFSGATGECTWKVTGAGGLVISGYGNMEDYLVGGQPWRNKKITSVNIKNGVTGIGDYAFYLLPDLKSMMIPESVTHVGKLLCSNCEQLTCIRIAPDNPTFDSRDNCSAIIETKSGRLVAGCSNTVIPNGVTSISDYAFYGCEKLSDVLIPDTVTSIGNYAFYGCGYLRSVIIPFSVTSVGRYAFYNCDNLWNVFVSDSVTDIGEAAFDYDFEHSNPYLHVTVVAGSYAENYMNEHNIRKCSSLSVTDRGSTGGCIWLLQGKNISVFGSGEMGNYPNSLALPWGNDTVRVAFVNKGVTSVGKCAFKNNKNLKQTILSETVTSINSFAFYGCTSLEMVVIPPSVTSIGESAFSNCNNLTIYGIKGSLAEIYATQHHISFSDVCPYCGSDDVKIYPAVAPTYTQAGKTAGLDCIHHGDIIISSVMIPMLSIDFTVGDISGNNGVGIEDATLLQQYLAEFIELDLEDEKTFLQADMNGDGCVNINDVTAVQRHVAELI